MHLVIILTVALRVIAAFADIAFIIAAAYSMREHHNRPYGFEWVIALCVLAVIIINLIYVQPYRPNASPVRAANRIEIIAPGDDHLPLSPDRAAAGPRGV